MCGLFGVIGKNGSTAGLIATLRDLGFMSALRGVDSTGVCTVDMHKRTYRMHKYPAPAYDFLRTKKADDIITQANDTAVLLGHTRAASSATGAPSIETSHPFNITGKKHAIVGMHNGFISNWDSKGFLVDSEWALTRIADTGPEALSTFDGSFALVWYDFDTRKVYIARNNGRTLYGAQLPSGKVLFASEHSMLFSAAARNNVEIKEISAFEPHHLYTFDGETGKLASKETFEPYIAPYTTTYGYKNQGWVGQEDRSATSGVIDQKSLDHKSEFIICHALVYTNDSSGGGLDRLRRMKYAIGECVEVYVDAVSVPRSGLFGVANCYTSNGCIPVRVRAASEICATWLRQQADSHKPISLVVRGSVAVYDKESRDGDALVCSVTMSQADEFDRLLKKAESEKESATSSALSVMGDQSDVVHYVLD